MTTLPDIPITPDQATYLGQLFTATSQAQATASAAVGVLCAGHGITGAVHVRGLGGTPDAPVLLLSPG